MIMMVIIIYPHAMHGLLAVYIVYTLYHLMY